MAGVYESAKERALSGGMKFDEGTVTAWLVTSSYVPDYGSHITISQVPSAAREASASLSGVSVAGGRVTASPTTFPAAEGDAVSSVVIEVDGNLVALIDDFGSGPGQTELALNGSDVTINWPATGIISLG